MDTYNISVSISASTRACHMPVVLELNGNARKLGSTPRQRVSVTCFIKTLGLISVSSVMINVKSMYDFHVRMGKRIGTE